MSNDAARWTLRDSTEGNDLPGARGADTVLVDVGPGPEGTLRLQEGLSGYTGCSVNQIVGGGNADRVYLDVPWAVRVGEYGGPSRLIVRFDRPFEGLPPDAEIDSARLGLCWISDDGATGRAAHPDPRPRHSTRTVRTPSTPRPRSRSSSRRAVRGKSPVAFV